MPGFALVVNKRNEILMVQRGYGNQKGQWTLPGGQQDRGESLKRTAIRETREETGIRISADKLYHKSDHHFFEIWKGRELGGRLKVQEKECLDAKWFQVDMLPHDDNLAFGPDKIALKKWAAENQGSRRLHYPRSPMKRSGFMLVVNHNDEILLVRRNRGRRAGKWSLPGANATAGERRREVATRETKRITGIRPVLEYLYFENRHQAQVWRGKPLHQVEIPIEGRWFPKDSLPDDKSLGFAIDIRTIEKWASENPGSRRARCP